jgi:CheY-like chemotaxis protein
MGTLNLGDAMTSVVMARSRASAIPSNAARTRPPCVLVADDDEDIRDLVAMSLRAAGYSVVTAADGAEALRVIDEENPDAAILDVMMPLVSGFQICRQMREDPATHGLPVIFFQGRPGVNLGRARVRGGRLLRETGRPSAPRLRGGQPSVGPPVLAPTMRRSWTKRQPEAPIMTLTS